MIPYGRQDITESDINAVIGVLRSDFLTQGAVVPEFECSVASKVGARFGVAVNSATSALHLACRALGLSSGDWLWTTPITFVASANCGLYCGAKIDFVDIDPSTYNICAKSLEKKLEYAEKKRRLPKVIVVVHLCGQSSDMSEIQVLSKRYGFSIIEDASHAVGGKYKGQYIGSCEYSDITVFSFHPVKIITTGEGGMAVTNSSDLAERMAMLRSHGITRDPELMTCEPDGPWYYQQIELGYNYRMTEIQAALGCSQLRRLDEYVDARNQLAKYYDQDLEGLPLTIPVRNPDCYSSFHLYIIRLDLNALSITHREAFERLRKEGVGVNLHYIPVHLQPYYKSFGFQNSDFPEAERYYSEAISIPMYPTITEQEQSEVVSALRKVLA